MNVFDEVAKEMARGSRMHGPLGTCDGVPIPSHPSAVLREFSQDLERAARLDLAEAPTIAAIFAEECGEALTAGTEAARRVELIQVAAVALHWVAWIDSNAR